MLISYRKREDDSSDEEEDPPPLGYDRLDSPAQTPPPMGWGRFRSPVPSIGSESPVWERSDSPISATSRTSLIGSPVMGKNLLQFLLVA